MATHSGVSVSPISTTELAVIDSVTAGTVTASKALVVDANKDLGDLRNLDCTNLDAGASGTAGSVDVFPSTASRGKLTLACTDQTGDTTVTVNANAMGQATTVNIPDPGAAASYIAQSTAALTLAEVDVLDAVTAGTVAASKAVVVDANKDAGDFRNLDCVNLDAGASGTAGTVDVFPSTASQGKLSVSCTDQTGDTTVSLVAGAMAAARTITLRDPGAAASILTTTDATAAATTATAVEITMAADNSVNVETVAAANVITAAESGATFFLSAVAEFDSTLPAPAAGLRYTFIVAAAPAGSNYTISTNASDNVIVGHVIESADAGGSGDSETGGADTINFVASTAVVGDRVDVICDGTVWYATCRCAAHGGITITTAS